MMTVRLFPSFKVFVESGLTNITMTWDPRLAENTKLEFKVEHDLFVRTSECRGHLGRTVIKNLLPMTTYNVTVHHVTRSVSFVQRQAIFSSLIRMPDISESEI